VKKGIQVCEEWQTFEPFYMWALDQGWKKGLQVDRIDNNGNYEPGNCRLVDDVTNKINRVSCQQYAIMTSDGVVHPSLSACMEYFKNRSDRDITESMKTGKHFWDRRNCEPGMKRGRVKVYAYRQDYLI
jgi:hypothetical protein